MQCQVKERHAGTLYVCCSCSLTELCRRSLPDPMGCSPLGSSVHGISWARILEWVAMLSFRGSSRPRGRNPHLLHRRWIVYRPAQLMVPSVPFEWKFAPFTHVHSLLWLFVPSPPDMSLCQNLFMPPSCNAMVFAEQSGKILKELRWKHYFSKQDTLSYPLVIGGIHKVNKLLRVPLQLSYHLEWFQTTCVKMALLRLPWWSSVWDFAFQPSGCRFDPWSGNSDPTRLLAKT